tara:strand:- start:413 stop:757 length:345 start_codon:yes stop_codon:yes gene_type:complete
MPLITLQFAYPLNTSLQIGDTAYYCPPTVNECTKASIVLIGPVTSVNRVTHTVICNITPLSTNPGVNDFILFSKDAVTNISSLKGYFAEAIFRNNSTAYAELFSVGADTHESSK